MRRIEILLGRPLAEVDAPTLRSLVTGRVSEDTDLDYKERPYGNADADKRDLAGDVAAMANTIGGVIVLGVAEVNGSAAKLMPLALSEAEALRMRQIVAALVAPVPQLTIHNLPKSKAAKTGFYLIGVPRSPDAPHAVRVNDALKYPRRDGARTRWLSESEVADAYRGRFQQATSQTERLDQIFSEGRAALQTEETAWLAIAISPLSPGSMKIRQRTISDARTNWVGPWTRAEGFGSSVFHAAGFDVSAGVGKIAIAVGRDRNGKSKWGHAELYQDGTGFAAVPLWSLGPPGLPNRETVEIDDEQLGNACVSALRFLVDHASGHTGAVGDALAQSQIIVSGTRPCQLTHSRQGPRLVWDGSRAVFSFPLSRHQINIEDCRTGTGLLVSARMLLTDAFQFFGVPEVPQINQAGELRRKYFRPDYVRMVEAWAAGNGVSVIETTLGEEP